MEPKERPVSNLGKSLKAAVRTTTKLGCSNQDSYYFKTTRDMYADPLGAHPKASNAYSGSSKCPHMAKSLAEKARFGVLFTQARAKLLGLTKDDSCPLCGERESIGHLLGRCSHPSMKPLYIRRHDDAVIKIYKALQKGDAGGIFTVIDAGTMQNVLHTLMPD